MNQSRRIYIVANIRHLEEVGSTSQHIITNNWCPLLQVVEESS